MPGVCVRLGHLACHILSAGFRHKLNKIQLRVSQSAGALNPSLKRPPVLSKGPPSFI